MTMKAELIPLLRRRWVTPVIALREIGCLSLSQRCGELRRDGVRVTSRWLKLDTHKRVKEYRILA
jgi:hypothetical protein